VTVQVPVRADVPTTAAKALVHAFIDAKMDAMSTPRTPPITKA
jgi:hypothetical protein